MLKERVSNGGTLLNAQGDGSGARLAEVRILWRGSWLLILKSARVVRVSRARSLVACGRGIHCHLVFVGIVCAGGDSPGLRGLWS